ncbi:MAG: UDP-glucose/GDP-mannose dehydrogenase family protein [Bdellovibrionales bacterium]|nr:UDP-glucose/GDP-mannose dehydrogenase family protein [Bdellovibrionales bacterium]
MKIVVVGTGYVGLVTGACFAETGNQVVCVDADAEKIKQLRTGKIPFYEPNLSEIVTRNISQERLTFATSLDEALFETRVVFVCVGTPSLETGEADLSQVFSAVETIAEKSPNKNLVIVIKSTVPAGTGDRVEAHLENIGHTSFKVVSNPEFLREGSAVQDCLLPDRIVIGTSHEDTIEMFRDLYRPFVRTGNPVLVMDRRSAEISKYAGNAFLAMRIAFINEMSRLCEKAGGDIRKVREAMGADHRIGMQYLFPSIGFGGSCFPKDVRALLHVMEQNNMEPFLLNATLKSNDEQKFNFVRRLKNVLENSDEKSSKSVAVWGLAFKAKTDDIRESSSLTIVDELLSDGFGVTVYDPAAMDNAKTYFGDKVSYAKGMYDAVKGVDALCILTEWNQFRFPDFQKLKKLMAQPFIFDGRNLYEPKLLKSLGMRYWAVGSQLDE